MTGAPQISSLSQHWPPKPKWPLSDIPDLSDRVIVVTGGNSGIGYETVAELMRHKAKVYLATRSKSRADAAIEQLRKLPDINGSVEFVELDLGDFRSIEAFAKNFAAREKRIDVLFNNAGVACTKPTTTAQGYEAHMGINAIGTHYLTTLLLPLLKAGGVAHPDFPTRVVFTSSYMHILAPPKGFDAEDPLAEKVSPPFGFNRMLQLYGLSKFCNILSARYFQRSYGSDNIIFTSVHPGAVRTNLANDANAVVSFIKDYVVSYVMISAKQGAYTQLYAGFSPGGLIGGAYFVPYGREAATVEQGNDIKAQDAFAKWADEEVAKHPA
ncbi:hypothetical protein MCUN1_003715 [Malassezia cuniculi]|uniref:NAD(P)-binding protein n=1 Tax=Malassezia cuniculi TaxID=948313 RepID=A0AAF0J877_9BASI|nr:hypothetical protein MCUN1_003715 [Malassezia cuniculi]